MVEVEFLKSWEVRGVQMRHLFGSLFYEFAIYLRCQRGSSFVETVYAVFISRFSLLEKRRLSWFKNMFWLAVRPSGTLLDTRSDYNCEGLGCRLGFTDFSHAGCIASRWSAQFLADVDVY